MCTCQSLKSLNVVRSNNVNNGLHLFCQVGAPIDSGLQLALAPTQQLDLLNKLRLLHSRASDAIRVGSDSIVLMVLGTQGAKQNKKKILRNQRAKSGTPDDSS